MTKYSPLLPHVAHRADLGYLIATVGGELAVGHSYHHWATAIYPTATPCVSGCSAPTTPSRTALSHQEDLRRRELESRAPGAAQRPGHSGVGGRLSARGERARAGAADQCVPAVRGNGGQADAPAREQLALARGVAPGDGRAGGQRRRPAHPRVDRRQPPAGGQAVGRAPRVRLAAEYRRARIHRVQPLLLRAAGQGRRDHRRALQPGRAWWPTTSSTSWTGS